jgi:sensor histidine kinase YesM
MKGSIRNDRWILYLSLALGYLAIRILNDWHDADEDLFASSINHVWRLPFVTLTNIYYFERVLPAITRRRKYLIYNIVLFIISIWAMFMFYAFGVYWWRGIGISLGIYTVFKPLSWNQAMQASVAYGLGSLVFFGLFAHIYNYYKLRTTAQTLQLEKQAAELNFLKSQTNPHFLFNTLNNIYSLTKYQPDLAPESILRLSKILRYMLYEASGPFIPVEKELTIIDNYIDLEKLRYNESLRINFSRDIEDLKQAIPPLLLIPFVENAFKHGVSESRGDKFVDIHLSIHQRRLVFTVKNSSEVLGSGPVKENIGLSNLQRQLKLLYEDYDLSLQQDKGVFIAILKINLSSHVKNQLYNR